MDEISSGTCVNCYSEVLDSREKRRFNSCDVILTALSDIYGFKIDNIVRWGKKMSLDYLYMCRICHQKVSSLQAAKHRI